MPTSVETNKVLRVAALVALLAAPQGCIKKALVDGQISSTRRASSALDTIGDYELVRTAAQGGLVQFEGMNRLSPGNEDALFLLTKGWVSYGFVFAEDDMESAQDAGDAKGEEYHRGRAAQAYERAVEYGLQLVSLRAKGFTEARRTEASLKAWLHDNFTNPSDGENLFWFGYAWLARTALNRDNPAIVADLWVGNALVERSVELNPSYNNFSGMVAMGSYHARAASAELDEAKKLFEGALAKTQRKALLVQLAYALRYACAKQDAGTYEKLLKEVIDAPESDPNLRLPNSVAKRRAKRWLSEKRMFEGCSMDPTPEGPVTKPRG